MAAGSGACTKMIGHALDLGVNFIDTANTYAGGTSEEFIGKAIKILRFGF